jgi:multiple antibiotic resistance protein
MPETAFLITAFATLFVVIDPPGLVPLFIALTRGMSPERRRAMAQRACLIAAVLLLLFGVAGEAILSFIGISMPALRIAGGIRTTILRSFRWPPLSLPGRERLPRSSFW